MQLFCPCRTFEFFLHADENFFCRSFLDTNKLCWKIGTERKILNEILKNIIKDMNYNESIKTSYIGFSFLIEALKMVR